MTMKENLERILEKFGDDTSLHGAPHVIKAQSLQRRIVWSIICLFSIGMALWMLYKLLEKYSSHPIQVRILEVCNLQ